MLAKGVLETFRLIPSFIHIICAVGPSEEAMCIQVYVVIVTSAVFYRLFIRIWFSLFLPIK